MADKDRHSITRLVDLFELLGKSKPKDGYIDFYRGHSDVKHILQPSIFRNRKHRGVEKNILRDLISVQPHEFKDDKTVFEQLVRMQHYGLPTRLLDVTYNPIVALYFACATNKKKDGEFLRLTVPKKKIKYYDSDAVSCVANLANLTPRQRNQIRHISKSDDLNLSDAGKRLLHFIKAEKSYFEPTIKLRDLRSILMVRPKQTNRRILAQQGAFLIFGFKWTLEDENDFDIRIVRTKVPASAKTKLLAELDGININASTLFPEIESATKYIISKFTPAEDETEQTD